MDPTQQFLAQKRFAVVGASTDRTKFGNKVLRCYLQNGRHAIPINPRETIIEGVACVGGVADLPPDVQSLSVITPPAVTERIVEEVIRKGVRNI